MKINFEKPKNVKNKTFLKKSLSFFKKYLTIIIIVLIFTFLFACDNLNFSSGELIIDNLKSIATNFTPTTDLFDDGSEVSFVSYFFGMNSTTQKESEVDFFLPTVQQNLSSSDECLSYTFDGTISAVASGTVSAVGYTTNGEKYVEIEHSQGYKSRYIGLNFIGVFTGESLSSGDSLGLVTRDSALRVYIYQNDTLIKSSEIEWKD
jgi:hypothetical protein